MTYTDIRDAAETAARETEHTYLAQALERHGWRIAATAEALQCGDSTLRKAISRYPDLAARVPGPGRPPAEKK